MATTESSTGTSPVSELAPDYQLIEITDEKEHEPHLAVLREYMETCSADASEEKPTSPLVLILMGRLGVGKSSTSNLVIGQDAFDHRRSAVSVTQKCQSAVVWPKDSNVASNIGRPVIVIDTPGLTDAMSYALLAGRVSAVAEVLAPADPAFALILVLGIHNRMAPEDLVAFYNLKHVFGSRFLERSVLCFTHGDLLEAGGLDEYLAGAEDDINSFLGQIRGGRVVVHNNEKRLSEREQARTDLLRAAVSVSGAMPTPRGKHARRMRQYLKKQQKIEEEGGPPASVFHYIYRETTKCALM